MSLVYYHWWCVIIITSVITGEFTSSISHHICTSKEAPEVQNHLRSREIYDI